MEKTNVFHLLCGLHQSSHPHCHKHGGPLLLLLLPYFFSFSFFFLLFLLLLSFLLVLLPLLLLFLLLLLHSLPHDCLCWMEEGTEKAWGQVVFVCQMEEGMAKTNVFHFQYGLHQSSRNTCHKHSGPLLLLFLFLHYFFLFFFLLLLLLLSFLFFLPLLLLLLLLLLLQSLPPDHLCRMEEGLRKVYGQVVSLCRTEEDCSPPSNYSQISRLFSRQVPCFSNASCLRWNQNL